MRIAILLLTLAAPWHLRAQELASCLQFVISFPELGTGQDDILFKNANLKFLKSMGQPYGHYTLEEPPFLPGQIFQLTLHENTSRCQWLYVVEMNDNGDLDYSGPFSITPQIGQTKSLTIPAARKGFKVKNEGNHQYCLLASETEIKDWGAIFTYIENSNKPLHKRIRSCFKKRLIAPSSLRFHDIGKRITCESTTAGIIPIFFTIECKKPPSPFHAPVLDPKALGAKN